MVCLRLGGMVAILVMVTVAALGSTAPAVRAEPPGVARPAGLRPADPAPQASPRQGAQETGSSAEDRDNSRDISTKALLTLAAMGGLLVVGLAGYVVRQRAGFWLHRPPPPGEAAGGPEHH